MSVCGGVLVPPEGCSPETPRELWVRVCYISLHPDDQFTPKQLRLAVDHFWPRSRADIWQLTDVERLLTHYAHQRCQNFQGGRCADPVKISIGVSAAWTDERRAGRGMQNQNSGFRAVVSTALTGVPKSEEHRAAISVAKAGVSVPAKRVPCSEETKAKISATLKRRNSK